MREPAAGIGVAARRSDNWCDLLAGGGWQRKPTHRLQTHSWHKPAITESPQPPKK